MRMEIHSAANFLVQLLRLNPEGLNDSQLDMFKLSLADVLVRRYKEHWFPEKPTRGSGYRCLRINGKMDPVIAQAGVNVGLPAQYLRTLFPKELTMWIDPAEVSYRIGENGSICVLYEDVIIQTTSAVAKGDSASGCKESLMLLDPHNIQPFEQRTAFVSS